MYQGHDATLTGKNFRNQKSVEEVIFEFALYSNFTDCWFLTSFYYLLKLQLGITTVYPKVSGLAAWSEKCKWYSSLPRGADLSLFCESV
jgi:hypothetical protein